MEKPSILSKENKVTETATISKSDIPEINKLVADDRESSRIRELITLLFEVLFLEDRKDQFSETLNVLELCLLETIKKANFSQALLILNQIFDLKDVVPNQAKDKLLLLERIINKVKDAKKLAKKVFFKSITHLREVFEREKEQKRVHLKTTRRLMQSIVNLITDKQGNKIDGKNVDLRVQHSETNGSSRKIIKTLNPQKYNIRVSDYILADEVQPAASN